jgi:hypothetical protein
MARSVPDSVTNAACNRQSPAQRGSVAIIIAPRSICAIPANEIDARRDDGMTRTLANLG